MWTSLEETTVTSDRLKTALLFLAIPGSCLVAESLGLLSFQLDFCPPAQAADFAHAKQIIVPASRYRRRYDSEMRESSSYSSGSSGMDSGYYSSGGLAPAPMPYNISMPSGSSTPKSSKNGLIPPPPAVTPSIITPQLGMMSPMSQPTAMTPKVGFEALNTPQMQAHAQAISSQVAHATAQLDNLLKEGKFPEAQALIKNYVKAFPKDKVLKNEFVQTLISHGKTWVASKDFDDAIKAAREALTIEPSSTTATVALNDWLKKKGVDHTSDAARLKMADTLAKEGKTNEALVEYRAALKLKPSADGHIGVGSMLLKEGKKETAKAEFQKALELDSNSGSALRHLGSLRYTQGDVIGANNDLSRALVINSEDKSASRTLIDLWQRQVAKNPRDASQHLGLARAYQLSGDLKSAQNEYKQVVRLEPENPNLPAARQSFKLALARQEAMKAFQAAQTLDTGGAIREAHTKIVEASGIAPTDVKIRLYEGDLATRLGLYSQAHDAYMAVIREEPKNTVAAKKLQELASRVQSTTTMMPATAPQAGLASPQVISFLNQNQLGSQPGLLQQLGSQVRAGELPPAATLPQPSGAVAAAAAAAAASAATSLPTDTHVSSLGGFLGALRGFQQTEKDRLLKAEDQTHKALGYSKSDSLGSSALNLPPLPPLPPMPSVLTTETAVSAGASATAAPVAAAPTAAAAESNTWGGMAMQAASSAASRFGLLPQQTNSSTATATTATLASAGAPTPAPDLAQTGQNFQQRIGSLEEQNRQLQQQLAHAHHALKSMKPTAAASETASTPAAATAPTIASLPQDLLPAPTTAASQAPPVNLLPEISPVPQAAPDFIKSKAQAVALDSFANQSISPSSNTVPAVYKASGAKPSLLPVATNSNGTVRFELEGVVPSRTQIKLKVVLKNDRDFPMELPPTVAAKIQMPGKPEQIAKVEFKGKQIGPHGELHGIIKVPGGDMNASADVFLPNFLPPSEQYRDVHLSVPISKL